MMWFKLQHNEIINKNNKSLKGITSERKDRCLRERVE